MIKIVALSVAFAAVVSLSSGTAKAAVEQTCVVSNVAYLNDGTNKLMAVTCNNIIHLAYITGGGCPTVDIDTMKIWQSTAAAAKLSGKTVNLYYTNVVCAGSSAKRILNEIDLIGP